MAERENVDGSAEDTGSYASALCMTCTWKLSGCDDDDTPSVLRRGAGAVSRLALQHAQDAGHQVSLIVTRHIQMDYRVERPQHIGSPMIR